MLPVLPGSEIVIKWGELSGTAVTVRVDAFVDKTTRGESAPGWLDETPKSRLFWTYTNRFTETNAGGGTNTVKFTPAANSLIRIDHFIGSMCDAAAGRTLTTSVCDEDASNNCYISGASLDNQFSSIPSIGGTANTASNASDTHSLTIPGDGSSLMFIASALAQNEYFDVRLCLEIIGHAVLPTITHTSSGTASTGTPTQNELTLVRA